jgi:hypothetical protein
MKTPHKIYSILTKVLLLWLPLLLASPGTAFG